jgi:hypothetical protein
MSKMARFLLIGFLLILSVRLCGDVFSEIIVLKSGKTIEGKIIEETGQYVKIDYSGITLTYWKTDIERIDKVNPALQPVEIKLKSKEKRSPAEFLNELDVLEGAVENIVRSTANKMFASKKEKLDNRHIVSGAIDDIKNKTAEIESLNAPDYGCRELQKFAAKIGSYAQQMRGGERHFVNMEERQKYWQDFLEGMYRLHRVYVDKKKALLDKLGTGN